LRKLFQFQIIVRDVKVTLPPNVIEAKMISARPGQLLGGDPRASAGGSS
jgi:hypothetical protein